MPENYNDGLIFREEEMIKIKVPIVAKPPAKVSVLSLGLAIS